MKSAELRAKFLSYFEARGHAIVPSAPLVPAGDPTLLFTNAGMVPFKDVFLGLEQRSYTRAASVQKCLRVSGKHNDLEEVGPSSHHHTFFEMLGNFSFGDYFKEEALAFTWEFLTKELGLPPEKLRPTVYEEDDESAAIWSRLVGLPAERIVRLGAEDNFWSMGETGPCGPNSEVMYDRTGACLRDGSDCPLTCDCDRWWELWNNVFMQYDRAADGTLSPLPRVGVDTGMGLERLCAVLGDKPSNYDTDLFTPIFQEITRLTGIAYDGASAQQKIAMRILADHARAATFLIADGIRPSNEGRGYVLRRVMRRAIYYARTRFVWNIEYMRPLVGAVGGVMSDAYPELLREAASITAIVEEEEERFNETLGRGRSAVAALAECGHYLRGTFKTAAGDPQARFNWASKRRPLSSIYSSTELPEAVKEPFLRPYAEILGPEPWNASPIQLAQAAALEPTLNGQTAFVLWDTFGVPPELAIEVAADSGMAADLEGFAQSMEAQRKRARDAHSEARGQDGTLLAAARELAATRFAGYESLSAEATVLAVFSAQERTAAAGEGSEVQVALDTSPFYAEGGGQAGDRGRITGADGEIEVETVRPVAHGVFLHSGRVTHGRIAEGEAVRAAVDESSRRATMRNHTATHLLHRALRIVLGPQAKQAGSLVAPDRLRFDFLHSRPLSEDELRQAERLVQEQVLLDRPVRVDELSMQEAMSLGADAMFDEKYGERVRVVSVGDGEAFSRELCGGTHCRATGEIGAFFIVEQRSIGAGVRRVEAVTGLNAYEWTDARRRVVDELSHEYNVPPAELPERLRALQERAKERPRLGGAKLPEAAEVLARAEERNGTLVIVEMVDGADHASLRALADDVRQRAKSAAVVLGSVADDKLACIVMLSADLVAKGLHAATLAKAIGAEMGGGGGGRPDVANAGGDPARLEAGLARAKALLRGED